MALLEWRVVYVGEKAAAEKALTRKTRIRKRETAKFQNERSLATTGPR